MTTCCTLELSIEVFNHESNYPCFTDVTIVPTAAYGYYKNSTPLYMCIHTREGCDLDPHMLPYT